MPRVQTSIPAENASADSYISLILGLAAILVVGAVIINAITSKKSGQQSQISSTQEQKTVTLPTTHTVTEGESLWRIAETYYKSGYNWVDIQTANSLVDADDLAIGQQLIIPNVPAKMVETGQIITGTTAQPKASSYVVVHGDCLWNIAVSQYGDGYRWTDIAKANNLANPDLIHAGNVLTLP